MMGLDEDDVKMGKDGKFVGPALPLLFYRNIPIMHEFNQLFDKAANPDIKKYLEAEKGDGRDLWNGVLTFLGRQTGLIIPGTAMQGQQFPLSAPDLETSLTGEYFETPKKDVWAAWPSQVMYSQAAAQHYSERLSEEILGPEETKQYKEALETGTVPGVGKISPIEEGEE